LKASRNAQSAFEAARKLLAKGIPLETIEECTGLDESEILTLS
jgi:hypothetical protein